MALLDMSRKQDVYLEVAHMNYHHRDSAIRDENIVRRYCRKYGIRFHLSNFKENDYKGNFQANARNARYEFFKKVCRKNDLDEVLIAHNLDDFIETYFMQEEKKLGVSYYGIKERNIINDVNVYRPLLKTEKKYLEGYCVKNSIEYGIDETNLSDEYTRNRIRHSKTENLSLKEKKDLYNKIIELNKDNKNKLKIAEKYLKKNSFSVEEFIETPYLDIFLHDRFPNRSQRSVNEMIRQLKESKNCMFEGKEIVISKEYDRIYLYKPVIDYEYVFRKMNDLKDNRYDYFEISETGSSVECSTISKKDFPIMIRNCQKGDHMKMRYGTRQLNRFFIDNKILQKDRKSWPVVVNGKGEVILVPGIGCDISHYSEKPNLFVIKLKNTGGH